MDHSIQLDLVLSQATARDLFRTSMERAAELARHQAMEDLAGLRALCLTYASGKDCSRAAFERLSEVAHLGAFALMTYGQITQSLRVLPEHVCRTLIYAGQAMQDRAHFNEQLFTEIALSPAGLYFDDLYTMDMLQLPHARATVGFDGMEGGDLVAPTAERQLQAAPASV